MVEAKKMVEVAYRALDEKKGRDIVIIDISEITPIADYFVICDGSNPNQVAALTDSVEEEMHKAGYEQKQREGQKTSAWILLDYGDVIVHIFDQENRGFYNLERIWTDGKRIASLEEL